MNAALARRLLAKFTGTGLLVAVVVGSGIAAAPLTIDGALRLLVNSVVTALGLPVLIVVISPSHHHRGGTGILLSEVVATAGLLFVIVALARTGRPQHVA